MWDSSCPRKSLQRLKRLQDCSSAKVDVSRVLLGAGYRVKPQEKLRKVMCRPAALPFLDLYIAKVGTLKPLQADSDANIADK